MTMDFISIEDSTPTDQASGGDFSGSRSKYGTNPKAKPIKHKLPAKNVLENTPYQHNKTNKKKCTPTPEKRIFKYESFPKIVRLHKEIEDFADKALPTVEECRIRKEVIDKITEVVKSLWPSAFVDVFGSYRTDLYLPSCDIDLVVFGKWQTKPLFTLKDELVSKGITTEQNAQVIDKATVPIIKLVEISSNIKVDIAFNTANGITSANQIIQFVSVYPAAKPLILLLKHFLAQRELNEVYTGGVSSYGLMLMIISFLQVHPRGDGTLSDVNLGVLLLEFFELYGCHLNYNKVGIKFKKSDKNDRVPISRYFRRPTNLTHNFCLPILDPCSEEENDVMKGCYNLILVQMAFKHAFKVLTNQIYVNDIIEDDNDYTNYNDEHYNDNTNGNSSNKKRRKSSNKREKRFQLLSKIMNVDCR